MAGGGVKVTAQCPDSGAIKPQHTGRMTDSAYGTGLIYRAMEDMGIRLHTPGATGGVNYKVEFTRHKFKTARRIV